MEASRSGEGGCCGAGGGVSECCEGQGRGRACEEACSDGPGRNENPRRFPLGPCRGGVQAVAA